MLPAALVALLGLALVILGLRGRRIGENPICRRCGFDLTGVYPAPVCPECGSGLMATRGPKPVRIGRRRRRWWAVAAGCILALVGTSALWSAGSGWAARTDWSRHKPVWLLAREGLSPATARSGPALRELADRIAAGKVSKAQLTGLAERALEAQADPRLAWYGATPTAAGWAEVLESAWTAGALRPDQIERFARQIASAGFEWRARVTEGDGIPARDRITSVRTTAGQRLGVSVWLAEVTVGSQTVYSRPFDAARLGGTNPLLPREPDRDGRDYLLDAPKLPAGVHPVRATLAMPVYAGRRPPVAVRDFEITGEIEILPRGEQTVTLVDDDSLRSRIESAMTIGPDRTRLILDNHPMRSWSSIAVRSPGIDLAYEVFWRVGEREWFVGEGFVGADAFVQLQYGGSYGGFKGRESELAGFDPATERVDIVLRPSAAVARKLMGFEKIWGGTVVIKDVPLSVDDRRSPPP